MPNDTTSQKDKNMEHEIEAWDLWGSIDIWQ